MPILMSQKTQLVWFIMELLKIMLNLKNIQQKKGYKFTSDTDTEVIAHEIDIAIAVI